MVFYTPFIIVNKNNIIETARSYLGTRYHHQGRVKGAGIDCCGLIICVAHELALSSFDLDGYDRFANGVDLIEAFDKNAVPVANYSPGDILVFKIKNQPQHCGILGSQRGLGGLPHERLAGKNSEGLTIIHAYQSVNKVVEHRLDDWWKSRIVAAYSFPNL